MFVLDSVTTLTVCLPGNIRVLKNLRNLTYIFFEIGNPPNMKISFSVRASPLLRGTSAKRSRG